MVDDCTLFPYSPGCDHLVQIHTGEFERLNRAIRSGGGFRLLLAQYNLPHYRDSLLDRLKDLHDNCRSIYVDRENPSNFDALQMHLADMAETSEVLHILGMAEWPAVSVEEWLPSLNHRREALATKCPIPVVLWLSGGLIKKLALQAPDMWAWRAGVFDFSVRSEVTVPLFMASKDRFLPAPESERRRKRIEELKAYLKSHSDLTPSLRASLLRECGDLHLSIGEPAEAMKCFDKALLLYESLGDEMNIAETRGGIADIHEARGELDEALRILREESLPIFERLGDVRSRAVTMGKIAGIHRARGEFDEALRILREESLPVFEQLGDVRSRAVAMGQIADIHQSSGKFDETALRIRREEELPIYERLGDVRSRAVTMGKIADIHRARGEFDEALRIYREERLPIAESLGEIRGHAVTMGKVADIHEDCGELDEALRIRREELLPVHEQLGDIRERAVTIGKIADIHQLRGEFNEALRIRREEELPVFERLGDQRSLLITRLKIGLIYLRRKPPRREEANTLLCQALAAARQMRIPEADQILTILKANGMTCDDPEMPSPGRLIGNGEKGIGPKG